MTGRSNGNVCHSASAEDVKMAENIQKWWDIEAYASKFNVKSQTKKEHEAEQMLQKSTVFTEKDMKLECSGVNQIQSYQ